MTDRYRALLLVLLPLVGCPLPDDKDSGDTADTDTADTADTDTADTDTADTDTGRAPVSEYGCYTVPSPATECPDPSEVPPEDVLPATCGAEVISVDGPGVADESCAWIGGMAPAEWCVYPITVIPPEEECDYGRPLVLDGAPRLAPLARTAGWVAARVDGSPGAAAAAAPTAPADAADRAALWARIGLAEHASVASFSRFALDLVAAGAPADLVQDAHAAALDEIRHAKLAFGLAARYAGAPLGPGPLPMAELRVNADLAALAAATAAEGCIAETLSALLVAEAHDRATDPAEKAALGVLARDEARHAALAWRTVRWALAEGGEPVRAALIAAFARPPSLSDAAGGLLPPEVARAVVDRAWREVIVPTADALLAGAPDTAYA